MTIFLEQSLISWVFRTEYPEGADARLDAALELLDAGKSELAEEGLRQLLMVCPDHIDALHHLGIIFFRSGRSLESYLCTREAVRIGLDAIPSQFSWLTSKMHWGILRNRPFMRAYHALGIYLLSERGAQEAVDILARLVSINPSDNLGARYLLMQCYLDLSDWQAAVDLSARYPHDGGPDMLYSRVVALLNLGRDDEAVAGITDAIKYQRAVATELLKTKHQRPKAEHPGYITSGGAEQAFDYWERNRTHWAKEKKPYLLLKKMVGK